MAKQLTEDQCKLLHVYYPPSDCCLCLARLRIEELETEVSELKEYGEACEAYRLSPPEDITTGGPIIQRRGRYE